MVLKISFQSSKFNVKSLRLYYFNFWRSKKNFYIKIKIILYLMC